MQKRILVIALLASLGLGFSAAQEQRSFTMELKPIRGEDGTVTMIHVKQTMIAVCTY